MRGMWGNTVVLVVFAFMVLPGLAQLHQFKPGFNLFTKDQDV